MNELRRRKLVDYFISFYLFYNGMGGYSPDEWLFENKDLIGPRLANIDNFYFNILYNNKDCENFRERYKNYRRINLLIRLDPRFN